MPGQIKKSLALLIVLGVFAIVVTGCAPAGVDSGAPQNLNSTVVVVQYVTQVVATVTPAPPTSTPLPPTAKPARVGYDPYTEPIYYPLKGCQIASRLHVGDRATVADTRNGTLSLHMSANIGDAPIFRKLNPGEVVEIIGGPFCRDQSLVWEVLIGDGEHGYIAEGNGGSYWILPIGESVDKETIKEVKKLQKLRSRLGVQPDCLPR